VDRRLRRRFLPRSGSGIFQYTVILILDFGSQYTQLIARRVREANVYCELNA
jgi:hypothetical protein